MYMGSVPVPADRIAACFAEFFEAKVKNLVSNTGVDPNVENGIQKPVMEDGHCMTRERVYQCIKQLKVKNSEGYQIL